jgi:hypothetical protein
VEKDWPAKRDFLLANFDLVDSGIIDDVDTGMYESEFREFLILKKRPRWDYAGSSFEPTLRCAEEVKDDRLEHMRSIWHALKEVLRSSRTLVIGLRDFVVSFLPRSARTILRRLRRALGVGV